MPPDQNKNITRSAISFEWQGAALALLAFTLMAFVAWLVSPGLGRWEIGYIQGKPLFATTDDAYRFFSALSVWQLPGVFNWSYILPVALLFDGSMATLFHQNMLWMRLSHAFLASLSIYALYLSGRKLTISPTIMLVSCLSLALMPLYAMESVSFYGESLLTADLAFLVYCQVHQKEKGLAFFTSIAPLIRPEGIFYLGPIVIQKLLQKRFLHAGAMILPGFIYGLYLFFSLPHLSLFQEWRWPLLTLSLISNQLGSAPFANQNLLYDLIIVNPIWILIGLIGLLKQRSLWPFWVGIFLWVETMFSGIHQGRTSNEARYFLSTLPFLTLGLALATQWFIQMLPWKRTLYLAVAFILLLTAENLLQLDPIRYHLGERRWPLNVPFIAQKHFTPVDASLQQDTKAVSLFVEAYLRVDPTVDKLFVNLPALLKVLKPEQLPKGVQVILNPVTPQITYQFAAGYFYGLFPSGRKYGLFQFLPAPPYTLGDHTRTGLYVSFGQVPYDVAPLYSGIGTQVYRVYYRETETLPSSVIKQLKEPL